MSLEDSIGPFDGISLFMEKVINSITDNPIVKMFLVSCFSLGWALGLVFEGLMYPRYFLSLYLQKPLNDTPLISALTFFGIGGVITAIYYFLRQLPLSKKDRLLPETIQAQEKMRELEKAIKSKMLTKKDGAVEYRRILRKYVDSNSKVGALIPEESQGEINESLSS